MFEHRLADAEAEFTQTIRERPTYGTAYVRSALMYATLKRFDKALDALDHGSQVEPLLATLPATTALVRMWRGELTEAIEEGSKAVELHPYLQISRANYAMALECAGRLDEALEQYQLGSVMSLNLPWMRALEATCLAKMGRLEDATAYARAPRATSPNRVRGRLLYGHAARRARPAHGGVRRARTRVPRELSVPVSIEIDPKMEQLRDDARFARVSRRDWKGTREDAVI